MKKLILLAIACALLAFWACARPGHVRNEAEFKGKTGVIGVFRQPAFYCEATPHYMRLGDSTYVVKPTWSNEQDNVFFAPHKPGTATLYSYSYDCGSSENKFVLDTTSENKGASGIVIPESGLCKIVISFVQGDKLFDHNDALIEEEFKKAEIALDPSKIPYGTELYVEGYGFALANDCGGAIDGNDLDLYMNSESACNRWGRRYVKVYVLSNADRVTVKLDKEETE